LIKSLLKTLRNFRNFIFSSRRHDYSEGFENSEFSRRLNAYIFQLSDGCIEDYWVLGCDAVCSGRNTLKFRVEMLPPSQLQVNEYFYLLFKLASKNVPKIKCSGAEYTKSKDKGNA